MKYGKRAFTLIELLIVVAIIAILAAIAVPNFLEAQVRSKVARSMADMRSMAVAFEEYAVDYNIPPLGVNDWRELKKTRPELGIVKGYFEKSLTTPIAYLTSIPQDPFWVPGYLSNSDLKGYAYRNHIGPVGILRSFDIKAAAMGYQWDLVTMGPAKTHFYEGSKPSGKRINTDNVTFILIGTKPLFVYDPSNGTVSKGFIIRTNKGIYNGDDYKAQ